MDWTNWIGLSPVAFERKLRRRLTKPLRYNDLVALYNELMARAPDEAIRVAAVASLISQLFKKRRLKREALLFLELRARCHFIDLNADQGFASLESLIDLDQDGAREVALELVRDVKNDLDRYGSSLDQRPRILAGITSVLHRYSQFEEMGDIYLEAAMLYSRHNASQAAYRSVNDAESIARKIRSLPLFARTYKTAAAVAAEEADFAWSIGAARKAMKAYRLARIEPPIDLLSNLAVAQMNLDQLEPAIANFKIALRQMPETGAMHSAVRVNLAACLRRIGDFDGAAAELARAEAEAIDKAWPDSALELAFGKAKLAEALNDPSGLAQHLREITIGVDATLVEVLRLHHRRGIRERYIPRIEALLRSLPDQGNAGDALLPLVTSRGSAFGDWLAILTWADLILEDCAVPPAVAQELTATLRLLRNLGVPHLFGFREKYDDPWEPGNFQSPWDTLSQIGAKLVGIGMPRAVEWASSRQQAALCSLRLAENHCLMMMTYAGENALLWYLIGGHYNRRPISLDVLAAWEAAQFRYAAGEASRSDFTSAIDQLTRAVGPIVDPIFEEVAAAGCQSVRFIQDFTSGLPLTMLALRNKYLSERMESGQFEVRIVPAMHGPLQSKTVQSKSVAAIVDPEEDLILAPFEGAALTAAARLPRAAVITTETEGNLEELLAGHDILIVSTHGNSLQFFTDAHFARLGSPGRPHPIRVASLQEAAPDLELSLAVLNTCYSGSASARNYQRRFRTSDAVAIPNLFLLNRRAVAVAGSWKISDTASFMFASLIGDGLKRQLEPSAASASAIAQLRKLPKAAAVQILETNLDRDTLKKAVVRLSGAPDDGMFSHPYFTGGLTIHGLL